MLNLGLDFGSTYSSVAAYRRDTRNVEPMRGMASPYIPSVVSVKGGHMDFGRAAKSETGKPGCRTFKGFKMLLPENVEAARIRGYDSQYTPEVVTDKFLEYLLTRAIGYFRMGNKVNRLAVGVPEIWFRSLRTVNARTALREICRKYLFVDEVEIVSEPAAACAFFAYNYYKNQREARTYDGTILLIDYGGGTLDITLTEIRSSHKEGDPGIMDIRVLEMAGAGENEEGDIGKAAIAYMETVMEESIRKAGIEESAEELRSNPRFYRAVDLLEEALQNRVEAIRDIYSMFGTQDPDDIMEEMDEFTTIEYRDKDIPVYYSVMLSVYNSLIRPVLEEKLDEMIRYMEQMQIPYMDRGNDQFKIALVGGFGNFYLVGDQIEKKFAFSAEDRRRKGIIFNSGDRVNAVSMGAALLAEGVIRIRSTAPYSVGICAYDGAQETCDYAFKLGQVLRFGEPYYPRHTDGKPVLYLLPDGSLSEIVSSVGDEPEKTRVGKIRREYAELLRGLLRDPANNLAAVGFSIDSSGVLSIHVREYDYRRRPVADRAKVIELNRLGDLLELPETQQQGRGQVQA